LKELAKTIRRKNGPEFLGLVGWYNRVIKYLVEGGEIGRQIGSFVGMPQGVWETILGQAYDRQVGPQLELLQGYETWSSNVYGELKPRFVSEIIRLVGLRPGMVFLDLGSGIGNIVLQVALEVGCVAVGFEIMDGCAKLANLQRSELVGRAHSLWGVNLGAPLLFQADFTKDPRVGQWLQQLSLVFIFFQSKHFFLSIRSLIDMYNFLLEH
jgi:H3 lysine-79-specific histone-lysine N-methyltransferase